MAKPHDWIPLTDTVRRCARCPVVQVGINHEDGEDVTVWNFDQFGQVIVEIDIEGCSRGDLTEEEPMERLMKEIFP